MRGSKVVSACIFNELQAVGLFLAFDCASTCTDHFTSGKKLVKGIFVSAAATSAFQLEHTLWLLRSVQCICMLWGLSNTEYRIWENISHVGLWEILWASIQGI